MYGENYSSLRRILVYVFSMALLSLGVYFMTSANLGVAPIISLPFVISKVMGLSLGLTAFCANIAFILIQVLILKKRFPKQEFLQIAASFLFSFFVDLMAFLLAFVFVPVSLPERIISFIFGLFLIATGVSLMSLSRLFMLPGDAISRVIAKERGRDFGKTKVFIDASVVVLSTSLSFFFLKRLEGVHIGTLITVLLIGNIVSFFHSKFGDKVEAFIGFEPVLKEEVA
ncbi:MAG: DUF6198 family protein [Lachnospiraceae bacterium]|nr:DUF6198 family protein [Lachnospiraceae bacterium]